MSRCDDAHGDGPCAGLSSLAKGARVCDRVLHVAFRAARLCLSVYVYRQCTAEIRARCGCVRRIRRSKEIYFLVIPFQDARQAGRELSTSINIRMILSTPLPLSMVNFGRGLLGSKCPLCQPVVTF
jgi:hypothetical protein